MASGRFYTYTESAVEIAYNYDVAGQHYQSVQYDFTRGFLPDSEWQSAAVQKYPRHAVTSCYVNPQDPAQAVLNRTFHVDGLAVFTIPLIFIFGSLGLWGGGRRPKKGFSTPR